MKSIKAILHDWDDTATQSIKTYEQWYFEFATHYGLPAPNMMLIRQHWGNTLPKLIKYAWPELSYTEIENRLVEFVPARDYTPPLFPGVSDTLHYLYTKGYQLGVISSGRKRAIHGMYAQLLATKPLLHQFIYTEQDCQYHKPDPRVFDKAIHYLTKHNISPNETVYIGDSLHDYHAAQNAGLSFIAVTTGIPTRNDFLHAGLPASFIVKSFSNIQQLF